MFSQSKIAFSITGLVLADGRTQNRSTDPASDEVGLFLRSAFIFTHSNQLSIGVMARCGQIARKKGRA
jgi:hypothetical protein